MPGSANAEPCKKENGPGTIPSGHILNLRQVNVYRVALSSRSPPLGRETKVAHEKSFPTLPQPCTHLYLSTPSSASSYTKHGVAYCG